MNLQEITAAQNNIKDEIIRRSQSKEYSFDKGYILDGVTNLEAYLSGPRIAWILKEAWDKEWGDWDLCYEVLSEQNKDNISDNPSFKRVAYTSYGIFKGLKWDDMPWINLDDNVSDCIKKIAWLNISNIAGDSVSPDSRITEAYNNWKDILSRQLRIYDPEIIILGNTYKWVSSLLEIGDIIPIKVNSAWAYVRPDGKIVIWAYHPSCRKKDETYIDDILTAIDKAKESFTNVQAK